MLLPSSSFILNDQPPPLLLLSFSINDLHSDLSPETTYSLTKCIENPIYNTTVPLSFKTYPEVIYTTLLIREHHDSYLYYIDTHSLVETTDEPSFSVPSLLLLTPMKPFVKTSTPLMFIFLSLMFSPHSSSISQKRRNSYLNVLPFPLLYKHSSKKKPFFTFPILKNFALLKRNPIIGLLPLFSKFTIFNINVFKISR